MPAILPIVLYNGERKWTVARSLKEVISNSDLFGASILNFKYEFLDINTYKKDELYAKQDLSSAIFLLDQNINREEFEYRLKDIVYRFTKLTNKEKLKLEQWLVNSNPEEEGFKENIEIIFNSDKGRDLEMTSNISKGLDKLKEEVKKEGANEKAIIIAKKMLRKGKSIEEVAEFTELSIEEIESLMN